LRDTNSKKKINSRDVKFLETQSNLDETLKLDLEKEVYIDADSRGSFDNIAIRDREEPTEDLESITEASQTTTALMQNTQQLTKPQTMLPLTP
jgi:hypothetical protein